MVLFVLLRPRPDRGGVFFLLWPRPDAHSLTVGWGDFGTARVVFVFFLLRPRRVLITITKNVWGATARVGCVCFFCFALAPCRRRTRLLLPGAGAKKTPWVVSFFCSGPVPAPNGASPSLAFRRGRSKKKTPWVVLFFCSGPVPARGFSFPCLSLGPEQKKNLGGVFFFLLRPRADAHSLTAGLGGDASPSPGWCCFFCCGPARTGVVFFFFFLLWPRPDAHSLTVGWGDFGTARVVFFFLLRPRRVFLDNNKKCLGYYIGSKKTRRGHSKKKTSLPTLTPSPMFLETQGSLISSPKAFTLTRCKTVQLNSSNPEPQRPELDSGR